MFYPSFQCRVRYQIISFLVFRFHSETSFWSQIILEVVTFRYQWPPEVKIWNRNTKKLMIWYLTWPIFMDFIFWPTEVIDIWRSRPPWSSEVKKGLRMESENQKAYDLIPHVTHLQWFHILTFLEVVIEGRSNWRSYVNISTWSIG